MESVDRVVEKIMNSEEERENIKPNNLRNSLEKSLNSIEHSLGMYAYGFVTLPAKSIYDKKLLAEHKSIIDSCHIYIIGYHPNIEFVEARQSGKKLHMVYLITGNQHILEYDIPDGFSLASRNGGFYLLGDAGENISFNQKLILQDLNYQTQATNFEVKYIGQSYGKGGSRNAINRLLKHETLQKISLQGVPNGYHLSLLLIQIQSNNQLFTLINPFAQNDDNAKSRIQSGVDKLFNTSEQERISLYEASLIRYFSPQYNKEFKNSFPSTNLKILQDCYEKDFSGIVAEICLDDLPYRLFSDSVEPATQHIITHDLHERDARRMFFGLQSG